MSTRQTGPACSPRTAVNPPGTGYKGIKPNMRTSWFTLAAVISSTVRAIRFNCWVDVLGNCSCVIRLLLQTSW
jgi:hypothetical protein